MRQIWGLRVVSQPPGGRRTMGARLDCSLGCSTMTNLRPATERAHQQQPAASEPSGASPRAASALWGREV